VGIVFLMTALFFVPSMVILLVTTGSLIHALNPVVFVGLAFRIGWAYFLIAQIFNDRLMSTEKAKKILGVIKNKYPDHDIMPHVESFLARP
jgi:hypothetical protein